MTNGGVYGTDQAEGRVCGGWVPGHDRSGLSIRAYCAQRGVKEPAFYWWRAELAWRDVVKPPSSGGIRAVGGGTGRAAAEGLVMEWRGGRVLRLPASLAMEKIGVLVRAIEGAEGAA